jgi:hypothetical protein
MLTETLLRILLPVNGRCSPNAYLSLAAGQTRNNKLVTGGFGYDFTESQADSCRHFIFSVKIADFGSLKRVTGRAFKLVNKFKETSYYFEFDFFIN